MKNLCGRMLIFSTSTNLELLSRSKLWLADGTSETVPQIFYQLYTVQSMHSPMVEYSLEPIINYFEKNYIGAMISICFFFTHSDTPSSRCIAPI